MARFFLRTDQPSPWSLCGGSGAQGLRLLCRLRVGILLRSADSVFPQFIKSNGIVLLREWMEEVATSPESVEEHEGLLASALKVLQRLRPARQDLLQSKVRTSSIFGYISTPIFHVYSTGRLYARARQSVWIETYVQPRGQLESSHRIAL